jgi:hypothetical protein
VMDAERMLRFPSMSFSERPIGSTCSISRAEALAPPGEDGFDELPGLGYRRVPHIGERLCAKRRMTYDE